jgi:hypothetical protein
MFSPQKADGDVTYVAIHIDGLNCVDSIEISGSDDSCSIPAGYKGHGCSLNIESHGPKI